MSKLTLLDAPKVSESLRRALPQLYRALKKSGAKRVPKLTWPAPAALAPRLAELPNQRRCPHYLYRRVRLLLQHVWKSELEVWIAELEIRAATPPGALYLAESARQRSIAPGIPLARVLAHARLNARLPPGVFPEPADLDQEVRAMAREAEARRAQRR